MISVLAVLVSFKWFFAAAACKHGFFFLPPWWEFLPKQPQPPDCILAFKFPDDIPLVGLAIVDMLLRIGGLIAIINVIRAGIDYMTAGGDVAKTGAARRRIYNSLIGLGIISVAAGLVAFVGKTLGG